MSNIKGTIVNIKDFISNRVVDIKIQNSDSEEVVFKLDANRSYRIPDFQREIRWSRDNLYELMSDKKLFKLMIDREIKSKDLAAMAGISPTTLAKMKKDGATVSSDVLVKICTALECTMDDIVEIVPTNK